MNISVLIYIYLSKAILILAHVYPNCVLESVCYISQQEHQYFFLPLHNLLVDVSTNMSLTNATETQSTQKVKILVQCKLHNGLKSEESAIQGSHIVCLKRLKSRFFEILSSGAAPKWPEDGEKISKSIACQSIAQFIKREGYTVSNAMLSA